MPRRRRASRGPQLGLPLHPTFGWGGAREGAGRKPKGAEPELPHRSRAGVSPRHPVHVTLRVREHVWNLRSRRAWRVFAAALRGVGPRDDFRVVDYAVQGNHLHLLVEVARARALANGMRALSGRLAKGLNMLMGRRGPVFADRYHAHVLATPSEVRHARRYVLANHASHVARRGGPLPAAYVDPFSSASPVAPDGLAPPVAAPRTWLLRPTAHGLGRGDHPVPRARAGIALNRSATSP